MAINSNVKMKSDNRDPITGAAGSHPVGTGIGAAVGVTAGIASAMAMGAATGAPLGPLGAIAGAAAGGILGGGIGHQIGEDINPTAEDAYWRENYSTRDYVVEGAQYDIYEPAYRLGVNAGTRYKGRDFSEIEPELSEEWPTVRGNSDLEWSQARHATRDAYDRLFFNNKNQF